MTYQILRQQVEALKAQLTTDTVEAAVVALLAEGEDVGGGVNATRLVRYLLSGQGINDAQVVWAYDRLKPTFRAAFDQIPSLFYFEGD